MPVVSDVALLEGALAGDLEAFDQLVRRHERRAYNIAFRIVGNHHDASDALQEALIRIYTHLPEFRRDSAFSTWLFRVVTNACLDSIRRKKVRPEPTDPTVIRLRVGGSPGDGPEESLLRRETQQFVQRAISLLPDAMRLIITLRDIQDLSYQEIAEVIGIPPATVKTRLHRARRTLSALMVANGLVPKAPESIVS